MRLKDAFFKSFEDLYDTTVLAHGVQILVGPTVHTAVDSALYIRVAMPMHRVLKKQAVFDMATINIVETMV
jgi:hypothetical protein